MSEPTSLLNTKKELIDISKTIINHFNTIEINVKKLAEVQKVINGYLPDNFYSFNLNHEYTKDLDLELNIITNELSIEITSFLEQIQSIETNQVPAINLYEFRSSTPNFVNIANMTNSALRKQSEILVKYQHINISQVLDGFINEFKPQDVINEYADIFNRKTDIIMYLNNEKDMFSRANRLLNNWNNEIELLKEQTIQEYSKKLDDEKNLVIKKFEHEAKNILNKFSTNIRGLEIDIKSALDSAKLMTTSVDAGLKSLALLNERTQKIELEFSSIIKEKTKFIDEKLNSEKDKLNEQLNAIRSTTYTKSNKLKNAQKDFIRLVERAGIYELTQNYKDKAVDEKKDYNFFSWATIIAISLAIITTIVIIAIPIIEHWGANPPVETNYFTILARLSISLMFFVLAVYTSKQSSKHYECYQENHRTFLQLAALEPFMARMSEEEQKIIRKGLIPIYFNQNVEGKFASKGEELGMQFNMQAFVEKFFEVGKNLTDKTNTDQSKPNG
ncbi:hypothetical protein [Acinetobacter baumannii]|uniref:hypothetical protein n=1 Tax=Acinetobacter baumannii TaxID=470 RepID=UPI003D0AD2E1|nr:hypothetical protein [Acinetobacter baumannii]